ncbi:MAG: T9SS type A sorting domain-containing protein [Saprospiraceae bacterium]
MQNISRFFYSTKLISCPLILLFVLLGSWSLLAQTFKVQGAHTLQAFHRGKTKPLSELAPMPETPKAKQDRKKANKPVFTPPNFVNYRRQPKANPDALPIGLDPVLQDAIYQHRAAPVLPTLVLEGIDEATSEVGVPDTNGDVGPDHYVQIVNASWFQVFAKDGTPLTPPTSANTIWSQINKMSFSDPVIVFDEAAGRWLLTDLAGFDEVLYGVSETSDPLGAWDLYSFITPSLPDYPKYGVWPNAYIFTINEGSGVYPVYALNRAQMLAGAATIDVQRIDIPGISGGFPTATPMDWNGPEAPASDELFVVRLNDDAWGNGNTNDLLEVWTLNIDWADPNNSTASETALVTAPYDSDGCSIGGAFDFQCIEQPGTTQGIDGIMTIIMNKVVYRNFGTHESAVLTFSVDAGSDVAGVRWMELRRTAGNDWAVYQEGTFAPNDGISRFIGSVAINGKGDIALAYSLSGPNTFPSLRYTGRRAGDPLGEMTVDEFEFATGEGVRNGDRYGDYANMTVDPIDDSFWFTSEYVLADGNYGTKIVNFSLGKDTLDISPVTLIAPVTGPDLGTQESVTVRVRNLGLEPASGFSLGYVFNNGAPIVESATITTLLPDSVYVHTFATKVDMSTIGAYSFKVFTTFLPDQNPRNDTLRQERRKLPRYDAGITAVEGLDNVICDTVANVGVVLTNFGTETLTSATIRSSINGGASQNTNWTGSLGAGASTTVNLPISQLTNGPNDLVVSTEQPNGLADQIPGNDAYARNFQVILGGTTAVLKLIFDFYSEETSWVLKDSVGNIIFSGDNYTNMEYDTIVETWCLTPGACYTFSIFDSYGDGVKDFFMGKDGSYSISDQNGNVLASILNANFGFQEDNAFCTGVNCNVGIDVNVTPESGVNKSDGAIFISISTGASPFSYSINNGTTYQLFPLFTGLPGGVYPVAVKDVNGCITYTQVTVETIVASSEPTPSTLVTVFPNPTENDAFRLTVGNPNNYSGPLEVQVVDVNGQTVLYQNLPLVDDAFTGLLSLRAYPAGVYFVRIKQKQMNHMVKVVKL